MRTLDYWRWHAVGRTHDDGVRFGMWKSGQLFSLERIAAIGYRPQRWPRFGNPRVDIWIWDFARETRHALPDDQGKQSQRGGRTSFSWLDELQRLVRVDN